MLLDRAVRIKALTIYAGVDLTAGKSWPCGHLPNAGFKIRPLRVSAPFAQTNPSSRFQAEIMAIAQTPMQMDLVPP
jgi:hypothetical protein